MPNLENKVTTLFNLNSLELAQEKINNALTFLKYKPEEDHLVFFIHGRGNHPSKANNKIIPHLKQEYNIKVLLFHWEGSAKGGPLGFPEDKARRAKNSLKWAFKALQNYKQKQNMKSCVLFTHSMGSLVLEAYSKENEFPENLFDNTLINASASATTKHKNWVDKINSNVYITYNNKDLMLSGAGISNRKVRLGRKLTTFLPKEIELSSNAHYIDFSDTGVKGGGHKYYINVNNNQLNDLTIHNFYDTIFKGNNIDFTQEKEFIKVTEKHHKILLEKN